MLRIGIVGLGDIAKKAYLPVLATLGGVELVACTRNPLTLESICNQYDIQERYTDYEVFLEANLDGVFITAATDAHFLLAKRALEKGVAVHLDKPISLSFEETHELYDYSKRHGVGFTVGFNRRFTPMIQEIKELGTPSFVVYQKNRNMHPDWIRRFVVEDFIHVIDTTRYLLGHDIIDVKASGSKNDTGDLNHLIVNFKTPFNEAVCIMNYLHGITEEVVEVNFEKSQFKILDYRSMTYVHDDSRIQKKTNDWTSNLEIRGFKAMCEHFITALKENKPFLIEAEDALETHILAEKIVKQIEIL